jgi:hypothetical protein
MPCVQFKQRYKFFPLIQISMGIVTLFKRYDGEPIHTVFSVSGEDVLQRCFNVLYYVNTVSQPDIDAVFTNYYCIQIIETWFAEQF